MLHQNTATSSARQPRPAMAEHHAQLAEDAQLRHDLLRAQLGEARVQNTGRYLEGDRFPVDRPDSEDLEDDEPEWKTHSFTLTLVWGEYGSSIVVVKAIEIETDSGVYVGEDGYNALTRWLEHHDKRLSPGARCGGQFEDEETRIWKWNGDSSRLWASIRDRYPRLDAALKALRCLARPQHRSTSSVG